MTIAQTPTSAVACRVSEALSVAAADIVRLSDHRAGRSRVWVAHEVIDAIDTINATIPRRLIETPSNAGTSSSPPSPST